MVRVIREEERAEAARDFTEAPRPLKATGPVPEGRLLVDDRRSAGPWLTLSDGTCVLDAASGFEHARADLARAYAEGQADLSGSEGRRPPRPIRGTRPARPSSVLAQDPKEAAARGVWLSSDGLPRVHTGFTEAAKRKLAAGGLPEPSPAITTETRVRAVSADDDGARILQQVLALEAEVYEPERRDPPEKLRKAFDHPDGVVVLAEVRRGDRWELVGFSMGVPLEEIQGVDGVAEDAHYGAGDTLYALTTTMSPKARGLGLGMGVKVGSIRAAAAVRRADGSPRYRWISGRNRLGSTAAMMRINRRLGADIIAVLSGQYGGDGEAAYYRMPVGSPVPADFANANATAIRLNDARRLTRRAPASHDALRLAGGLYGPWMSPVRPDSRWTTPTIERARRLFATLDGELPYVAFGRRYQDLAQQAIAIAGPLRSPEEAKGGFSDETRTAAWRGDQDRFFLGRRLKAALWSPCEGLVVLHSREPVMDAGGDALAMVRAQHDVAALADSDRRADPLEPLFRRAGFQGGEAAGRRRFFTKEVGERGVAEHAAQAREQGVLLGMSRVTIFAALPWDLTDPERATIGKMLER